MGPEARDTGARSGTALCAPAGIWEKQLCEWSLRSRSEWGSVI